MSRLNLEVAGHAPDVALASTVMEWSPGEIVPSSISHWARANTKPLLVLFLQYKLHGLQCKAASTFEFCGNRGSLAETIHSQLDNANRGLIRWAERMFGTLNGCCRLKELITAPQRRDRFVVEFNRGSLSPADISISWNGKPLSSPNQLIELLAALGITNDEPDPFGRLLSIARFTNRLRVVATGTAEARGLGAPPGAHSGTHHLGSLVRIGIRLERKLHVLLLDKGPEGILYCLCPSVFAPESVFKKGIHYLPTRTSAPTSFELSGSVGREYLVAILSDDPLDFDLHYSADVPAARVSDEAVAKILTRLAETESIVEATSFSVVL